ncbi:hypothetical protein ACFQX6_17190 [Streptosporangium lutulentum]
MLTIEDFLPDPERSAVAIEPAEPGEGHWAGAPSAVASDGLIYLAYRLRRRSVRARLRRRRRPILGRRAVRDHPHDRPSRRWTPSRWSGPRWSVLRKAAGGST